MSASNTFSGGFNGQPGATFTVKGDVDPFLKSVEKTEIGVKRASKALHENALALDREIKALKEAEKPNLELIKAKESLRKEIALGIRQLNLEAKAMAEATKQNKAGSVALKGIGDAAKLQTSAILGFTLGIVGMTAAMAKGIQTFGQFERTLNTIKAVSNATKEELAAIKQSSLDLGASTIFSNQEVANSYLELAKKGFTAQESLAAMPGLLQGAAAAGTDLTTAVEIITGTLKGFNLQATDTGRVSDVLAKAANVSSAGMEDLGDAMKQAAPLASAYGISLETTAAALSLLADNQIKGSDAGTDFAGILRQMNDGTKTANDALKTLGVTLVDVKTGKLRPFIDIMADFKKAMDTKSVAEFNKEAARLVGGENLKSFIKLVEGANGKLVEYNTAMGDAAGASKEASDIINQGVNTAMEQFGGTVDTLFSKLGEELAPAFVEVTNELIKFLSNAENTRPLLDLARSIGDAVVAVKDLIKAFLEIPFLAPAIIGALNGIVTGLDAVASAAKWATNGLDQFFQDRQLELKYGRQGSKKYKDGLAKQKNAERDNIGLDFSKRFVRRFAPEWHDEHFGDKKTSPMLLPKPGKGGSGTPRPDIAYDPMAGSGKKAKSEDAKIKREEAGKLKGILDDLKDGFKGVSLALNEGLADMGPYTTEMETLGAKSKALKIEQDLAQKSLTELSSTSFKNAEVEHNRKEAIEDVKLKIKELTIEQKNLQNETIVVTDKMKENAKAIRILGQEIQQDLEDINNQDALDALQTAQSLNMQLTEQAYNNGRITFEQFKEAQIKGIQEIEAVQAQGIQSQIDYLKAKADVLNGDAEFNQEYLETLKKIYALEKALGKVKRDSKAAQTAVEQGVNQSQQNVKDSTYQAIKQAFVDAMTSGDILTALKNFGASLKSIVINAFADALTNKVKGFFDKLIGKVFDAFTGKGGGADGNAGAAGAGQMSKLAKTAGKYFGGAVAGAVVGYGVGTSTKSPVAGGAAGAVSGAVTGFSVGGPWGAAIGAVVGAIAGIFGGSRAKKKAEIQKIHDESTKQQQGISETVGKIDQSDLNLDKLAKLKKTVRTNAIGPEAEAIRRQNIDRVDALFTQRQKEIKDFIKSTKDSTRQINQQVQILQAEPYKQATLERKFALEQLERDTKDLLKKYKDSQKAQTQILAEEAAKRKLIEEQSKKSLQDTLVSVDNLLNQRDDIANSDVFTRAKSRSQQKADDIAAVDKQLMEGFFAINEFLKNGVALPDNFQGLDRILGAAQVVANNQTYSFVINDATDPEAVARAIQDYLSRAGLGDVA